MLCIVRWSVLIAAVAALEAVGVSLAGCAGGPSLSAEAVLEKPRTGFIQVEGGRVWYSVRGTGTGTPLLVLHGGPGIPHDYLENLEMLGDERPVVFYDQLGCGRSDRPDDPSLWTRERFAREIDRVRGALGLDEVVLYGHSWGSILAVDYLSGMGGSTPTGVRGVILAGPALSIPRWTADSRGLITALGPDVSGTIFEAERTGQTDSPAYRDAVAVFYKRYVCRLDPWPEPLDRAMAGMGQSVYGRMSGPSEFTVTGSLKDVDVTPRLHDLRLPTLFICGEYDEATPESTRYYAGLAPNSSVVVIPGASHVANYDQPERYMAALRGWLGRQGF
ncbi:MAG: proline iminopeptidase-family hydrolase [Phycisphaerales bacterium]|nr:proline iminopeptidase-family hydrolase [Phycisphaerales bacterium]